MRFCIHFGWRRLVSLLLIGTFLCYPFQGKAEETVYVRVIAHDDTPLMQQQKLLLRNRILCALNESKDTDAIEKHLLSNGFPMHIEFCLWTPSIPLPAQKTLVATLGKGEGHNWWGALNPELYSSSLFETPKKSGAAFRSAVQNKTVVFPFLDPLFRSWKRLMLIFERPAPAANWSNGSKAAFLHPM